MITRKNSNLYSAKVFRYVSLFLLYRAVKTLTLTPNNHARTGTTPTYVHSTKGHAENITMIVTIPLDRIIFNQIIGYYLYLHYSRGTEQKFGLPFVYNCKKY